MIQDEKNPQPQEDEIYVKVSRRTSEDKPTKGFVFDEEMTNLFAIFGGGMHFNYVFKEVDGKIEEILVQCQELDEPSEPGGTTDEEWSDDKFTLNLAFSNPKSIDVMMEVLDNARKCLRGEIDIRGNRLN